MTLRSVLKRYVLPFVIIGQFYALIEYLISLGTTTPESFWLLVLRVFIVSVLLGTSIGLFDLGTRHHFTKRPFLYLVFLKAISYTLILSFWLIIGNGLWEVYANPQITFIEGTLIYINQPIYIINLTTIFGAILIFSSLAQINSLHRKGELLNFVTGRYHQPVEVERIFAFIDLIGSTTIAENLGNQKFGLFLKDYYSDITEPIRKTRAEIYQYVGDEIVLSWTPAAGLEDGNVINCIMGMAQTISDKSSYYESHYGYIPKFRSGVHLGRVLVTWVGELKKEILYIGDVMNTAKRIQEDCKRLHQDLLFSEEIAHGLHKLPGMTIQFMEQAIPRGKEKPVKLYTVMKDSIATMV